MSSVTAAVLARKSCRAFLKDKPVSDELITELLTLSCRAPSGGNLQPWKVHVVNGQMRDRLVEYVTDKPIEGSEYDIYPTNLAEPYRSRRAKVGNDMYAILGIGRRDTAAKLQQVAKNFDFFDAPCGLIFSVELNNPPQWSDIGMFMQTFMLLATERGLATCAQEAWANHSKLVKEFLAIPDEHILFAGIAVGYEDEGQAINKLQTERAPLNEIAIFHKSPSSKL